jgi:RNA polymerase-binding transcription factor DksA
MARGEYGICTRCGEEISPERLEAVPEAPLCKTCAAEV